MLLEQQMRNGAQILAEAKKEMDSVRLCALFLNIKLSDGNEYPEQTPEQLANQLFAAINRLSEQMKKL